jgi:tRNA (guanine37-N1)-methyltransferase
MFCGVGPFAVPAARKGCVVYCNDLNPTSYHYLLKNISRNKINEKNIFPHNGDARAYVRDLAIKQMSGTVPWFHHIAMNLPAAAPEFLDVFRGLYSSPPSVHVTSSTTESKTGGVAPYLPTIHCYCFAESDGDTEAVALKVIMLFH